jgi:hypothetical protein
MDILIRPSKFLWVNLDLRGVSAQITLKNSEWDEAGYEKV